MFDTNGIGGKAKVRVTRLPYMGGGMGHALGKATVRVTRIHTELVEARLLGLWVGEDWNRIENPLG